MYAFQFEFLCNISPRCKVKDKPNILKADFSSSTDPSISVSMEQ